MKHNNKSVLLLFPIYLGKHYMTPIKAQNDSCHGFLLIHEDLTVDFKKV